MIRLVTSGLMLILCITMCLIAGCGKKGMPVPKDSRKSFSWQSTTATATGNCITFAGSLSGAHDNFDRIRLELASVNGPDDCPGCPFVPKETVVFSRKEAGFNSDTGEVSFSYCPTKAKAYRWRLIGISKFNTLAHTVSPERLLVMEE